MVGSEAQRAHYKEASPVATVERLHTILAENNIPVTESWQETSSIKTNALRVEFKGTGLGANGKGVSKEFARASGYAELFERYQNDMMGPRVTYGDKLPFLYAADERIMSSKEIASQDNAFIHMYFSQRGIDGSSVSKKAQAFRNLQKVDSMVYGLEDSYVTLPFYSMRNQ